MPQRRPTRRESGSRRTDDVASQEIPHTIQVTEWRGPQPGECRQGICGKEAACKRNPNATHMCLCPHDSSPPTADLKCPNRLTVPLTPRPIHNIIPPSGNNGTSPTSNISTSTEMAEKLNRPDKGPDLIIVCSAASLALLLIIVLSGICWWKRKYFGDVMCKEKSSKKSEAPRTGEPLLAERYIANPQYSSAYNAPAHSRGPAVPLLQREGLRFLEEIGEGCFGKVYKGEMEEEGIFKTVAIKVLKDSASRTAEDDFIREVNIMSAFHHENILTLIGVVQRAENGLNPWMVFEFMPFGDLAGVLRSNSHAMRQPIPGLPTLDSKSLLFIALQVACGMQYLASQRFVHRDLACRNCLVGKDLVVKIADFGMSRDVYTCDYYKMGGNRPMPIRWMSPESIVYARFTLESDVWSYGVVLWEIYSLGKQPFYGHNNDGASKLILQGIMLIPPEDCPTFVCELMRACWRTDPKDRIRFQEVCDKLRVIQENGEWDGSGSSDTSARVNMSAWTRSIDRRSKWSVGSTGLLPRPPVDLPPATPMLPEPELTDPEGYLLPALPPLISDYLTTLPDVSA